MVVESNAADPAIFAKLRREILFVIYALHVVEVSTTCGSGWVGITLRYMPDLIGSDPPATAGGTDVMTLTPDYPHVTASLPSHDYYLPFLIL